MHAIALCGSPRKNGNTQILLERCLAGLSAKGMSTEFIPLHTKTIHGCRGCGICTKTKDKTCHNQSDDFHPIFETMQKAEVVIVGSPVYFGSATPEIMALLDRAGYVSRSNGGLFQRKLGGPFAVARRAGHTFTYAQLLLWFMINEFIVPGSTYWNVALAREPGKVLEDTEALATADRFAENLVWLAERIT